MAAKRSTSRRTSVGLVVGLAAAVGLTYAGAPAAVTVVLASVLALFAASVAVVGWGFDDWMDWLVARLGPWLVHRVWLYRVGLAPAGVAIALAALGWLVAALAGPAWWPAPIALAAVAAGVVGLAGQRLSEPLQRAWLALVPSALDDGRKGVLDRAPERLYLAGTLLGAGAWLAARLYYGATEPIWWALGAGALAYGLPWWWHRGYRRRRAGGKWARRWKRVEGNDELKAWHGSKVVAVEGNRKATTLVVRLRSALTVKSVSGDALSLASALGLRPGAVTVALDPAATRRVRVRIVPRDPWRGVLAHPLPDLATLDLAATPHVRVGDYEDATPCHMKLQQHMLVVGQTGSGKSVWLEALLAWLLAFRHVAIVAADLASGATFGVWADVFAVPLATDVHSGFRLIDGLFREVERREAELGRRKRAGELIDTLPPSQEWPAIFAFVDEFPDLIKAAAAASPRLDLVPLLERLANKARKVNVWIILGAQNPTAHDVGSTELRGALTGIVGLALSEQQSKTLWGTRRSEGWDSLRLRIGTFLLSDRDPAHQEPRTAKGLYLSPRDRLALIRRASRAPRALPAAAVATITGGDAPALVQPKLTLVHGGASPALPTTPSPRPAGGRTPIDLGKDAAPSPRVVDAAPLPPTPADPPPTPPRVLPAVPAPTPPPPPEPTLGPVELDALVLAELPDVGQPTVQVAAIAEQIGVSRDAVNRSLRRLRKAGQVRDPGRGRWERMP